MAMLIQHRTVVILPALPFTALTRQRASLAGLELRRIRYTPPVLPPQHIDATGPAPGMLGWSIASMAMIAAAVMLAYLTVAI